MQQNLFLSSLSEIKVAYTTKVQSKDMHKIGSSKDAETVLRLLWSPDLELREEFNLLLLNRANKVTGWFPVSKGGVSGTVVDMKLIFSIALNPHFAMEYKISLQGLRLKAIAGLPGCTCSKT